MEKDPYQILGVGKSATQEEIHKAYKKLAKKYHPDLNSGDRQAEEKFKELQHAYDLIGSSEKRRQYEQMQEAARAGFGGGPGGAGGMGGYEDLLRRGQRPSGGGTSFNFEDLGGAGGFGSIFEEMFDLGSRRRQSRYGPRSGEDLSYEINIPFEQAALGGRVTIRILREATCSNCQGSGAAPGSRPGVCEQCGGSGTVLSGGGGNFAFSRSCPRCFGRGVIITNPCVECGGRGTMQRQTPVTVNIPPGVSQGQKLRLAGLGNPGLAGGPPGDLILTINIGENPDFTRDGHNLLCEQRINIVQGTLGDKIHIPTLEGGSLVVTIPPGIRSGAKLRLRGRGVLKPGGGRGDLLVTVYVDPPQKVTKRQKDLLQEFAKAGESK